MEWASWSAAADRILHSPNLPVWAAIAAAVVFTLILIIALLRADRSVANGVLGIVTLLAVGVASFAAWRLFVDGAGPAPRSADASRSINAMPALACVDDLAGDAVQAACERALFGSPEMVAAAVSYASARLAQLTSKGDVAAADKRMTPELDRLRRSIERDRYGLIAYVLTAQDRCVPDQCAAFQSLTDHSRIAANMNEHLYELTVTRAAPSWGAGSGPLAAAASVPGGVPGVAEAPSGKPVNIDFATSSSIPPISIMTEPGAPKPAATAAGAPAAGGTAAAKRSPAAANAQAPASAAGSHAAAHGQAPANAQAAVKRPAPPKPKPPVAAAPVQLAPAEANSDN